MPTERELLAQAGDLQERGREVLNRLGLLEAWSRVGQPVLVGSLRFGLMVRPNLDMEIYTDQPLPAEGFAVVGKLAGLPGVRQVLYLNALDTADQGLYWRLDYEDEQGEVWDIDQWLVAHDHPHAGLADGLAQAMTAKPAPAQREAVLSLKASLDPGSNLRGVDLYKAVMAGGVTTPAELERWLADNPPPLIETWRP